VVFYGRVRQEHNIPVMKQQKTRYTKSRFFPVDSLSQPIRTEHCLNSTLCRKIHMDITNKARIHWACRRGMRELDISIMPFFEYEYDTLSDEDKKLFIRLLENDDPDLFNWLMNHGEPADAELQRMVLLIQTRNRERGPVAI
jgi:antitoxin CptB